MRRVHASLAIFALLLLGSVGAAEQRSITGPAQFEPDGEWMWLKATDGTSSFKAGWLSPPVQLEEGATYTFIVEFHQFTQPSVEKILQGEKVIYDSSVCEVHHISMRREEVPLDFGYGGPRPFRSMRGEPPSDDVCMAKFPHYIEVAHGGCVDYGERTAMVYRCEQCKAAFLHWRDQHASHQ